MFKTTEEQLELFKEEFMKWIEVFNFENWNFYFNHLPLNTDSYLDYSVDLNNKTFVICLNEDWDIEPTNDSIVDLAFEEVNQIKDSFLHDY